MTQLIWIVYFIGLCIAFFFGGTTGRFIYMAVITAVVVLFRRPLVLALTRLSSNLGLMRGTIDRMPSAIHLSGATGATEAARPLLAALAACKFVDAGNWNINELPKIQVSLMVQPEDGMLAVVESASSIGAQVNIHTLYPDGKVFSVTNSQLPAPRTIPANVTRKQFPRCVPGELVKQAHALQPGPGFRLISAAEAPRIYEYLYAEAIRARKETGR